VDIAYLIGAWLLPQIADLLIVNIGAPDWVMPPWRNGTTHVMFEPRTLYPGWSYRLYYDRNWPFAVIHIAENQAWRVSALRLVAVFHH
jgi:hypothetical protein